MRGKTTIQAGVVMCESEMGFAPSQKSNVVSKCTLQVSHSTGTHLCLFNWEFTKSRRNHRECNGTFTSLQALFLRLPQTTDKKDAYKRSVRPEWLWWSEVFVCFTLVRKAELRHTGRQHGKTPQNRGNVQQQCGFRDEMNTFNIKVPSLRKNKLGANCHFPTMTWTSLLWVKGSDKVTLEVPNRLGFY